MISQSSFTGISIHFCRRYSGDIYQQLGRCGTQLQPVPYGADPVDEHVADPAHAGSRCSRSSSRPASLRSARVGHRRAQRTPHQYNFAHVVHDHRNPAFLAILETIIEERHFSHAQEPGQNGDGEAGSSLTDIFFCIIGFPRCWAKALLYLITKLYH